MKIVAPLWPLSLSRMAIGWLWLLSLRWKLPPDFAPVADRSLLDWLHLEIQHPLFPIYATLIENLVLPRFATFAWLIFMAELLVGLSLLLGCLTRLGALLGLLLSVNLAIGLLAVPGEWPWSYLMLIMWHGVFLITSPGRLWGVDVWLRTRRPDHSAWRMLTG